MIFIFRGDELLVRESGVDLPDGDTCAQVGVRFELMQQIWLTHDPQLRTTHVARDTVAPPGYAFRKLRAAVRAGRAGAAGRPGLPDRRMGAHPSLLRRLRHPMQHARHELCLQCPACGLHAYPRVSPAMMVLIKRGEHILLARHARYATARYTALAGFVEVGESIEDAVHREVEEEVGLRVRDLRYFGSQSWPFPIR